MWYDIGSEERDTMIPTYYDYYNQAWVVDGKYAACGHPESLDCNCYGKLHAGETAPPDNWLPADRETT